MFFMQDTQIDAVVFDLGNVLIPWNPRNLYRKLFKGDDAGMERFISTVCTPDWSDSLDSDQSFAEGTANLISRFPEQESLIRMYDERWDEMLGEPIAENVSLLSELHQKGWPLYALSNWPIEKLPLARARFGFFSLFRDMVISGEVGFRKPNPAIFRLMIKKNGLNPARTVFIDDTMGHIEAARSLGLIGIRHLSPAQLRADLLKLGIP